MKRLTNTKVLQKANLFYKCEGKDYKIGTISKEFMMDRFICIYVIDLDKNAIDELKKIDKTVNSIFIPGVDLDLDGYYIASSRIPYIVQMRVVDKRRDDLQKYLDMFNMEAYDAFTMFMRNHGYGGDNFWVEEVPVE